MRVGFAASVTIPFSCVRRSHHELHLLPDWVLMVVGFAGRSDIPPNNLDRSIPSAV